MSSCLAKTGDHGREQLQNYLLGHWRSGREYRFVLIASDGIRWRRYAPNWAQPAQAASSRPWSSKRSLASTSRRTPPLSGRRHKPSAEPVITPRLWFVEPP